MEAGPLFAFLCSHEPSQSSSRRLAALLRDSGVLALLIGPGQAQGSECLLHSLSARSPGFR